MEKTTNEKKYLIVGMISTFVLGFALGGIFTTLNSDNVASKYNYSKVNNVTATPNKIATNGKTVSKGNNKTQNGLYNSTGSLVSKLERYYVKNTIDINKDKKVDVLDGINILRLKEYIKGKGENINSIVSNNTLDINNDKKVDMLDGITIIMIVKEANKVNRIDELNVQNLKSLDVSGDLQISKNDLEMINVYINYKMAINYKSKRSQDEIRSYLEELNRKNKLDINLDGNVDKYDFEILNRVTGFSNKDIYVNFFDNCIGNASCITQSSKRKDFLDIVDYIESNLSETINIGTGSMNN